MIYNSNDIILQYKNTRYCDISRVLHNYEYVSPPNIISSLSYLKASNFIGTLKLFPSAVIWDEVWHDLHNCVIFILADYFNRFIKKKLSDIFCLYSLNLSLQIYFSIVAFRFVLILEKKSVCFHVEKIIVLLIKTVYEINCHEMFSLYKKYLSAIFLSVNMHIKI